MLLYYWNKSEKAPCIFFNVSGSSICCRENVFMRVLAVDLEFLRLSIDQAGEKESSRKKGFTWLPSRSPRRRRMWEHNDREWEVMPPPIGPRPGKAQGPPEWPPNTDPPPAQRPKRLPPAQVWLSHWQKTWNCIKGFNTKQRWWFTFKSQKTSLYRQPSNSTKNSYMVWVKYVHMA